MPISKILSVYYNRHWKKKLREVEIMFLVGRERGEYSLYGTHSVLHRRVEDVECLKYALGLCALLHVGFPASHPSCIQFLILRPAVESIVTEKIELN